MTFNVTFYCSGDGKGHCGCRFSAAEACMDRHAARDERKRQKAAERQAARQAAQVQK